VLLDDRYELGALLGTGGMARVHRATDRLLGREVAVKVFRDDLDDDEAARVEQEMHVLTGLSHPGLVGVHGSGTNPPYLVLELVEGPTLATATDVDLTAVGAQVAEALAYVHSRGVVHRDVKPANILLSAEGAKLTDFGIARMLDGARRTGTGLTVGTAPYLAPEQVTGDPVTPATDVYALGLVLLERLKGEREYVGTPVEAALQRLHRRPEVPATLPAPWPGLLEAMTTRLPSQRPTAAEVAHVLRGEATVTRPLPVAGAVPTRVARVVPVQRGRAGLEHVWMAAGAVAVLLVGTAIAAVGTPEAVARTTPTPTPAPSRTAVVQPVAHVSPSPTRPKPLAPAPAPAKKKKHGKRH
jgi:serine/threonine protein kinase